VKNNAQKGVHAAAVIGLALTMACGDNGSGGGGSPTTPSGTGPGPSGATITIGSNGVSPSSVSIAVGQSVTFVNSSGSSRDMASDPHPAHTSCPSINAVGILGNGQTRLTNSFSGAGTCTFHDHALPDNNGLKGTITIR
jgi:plastocyanin